jgi:hypothetical protein
MEDGSSALNPYGLSPSSGGSGLVYGDQVLGLKSGAERERLMERIIYRHKGRILEQEEHKKLDQYLFPSDLFKFGSRLTFVLMAVNLFELSFVQEALKKQKRLAIIRLFFIQLGLQAGVKYYSRPIPPLLSHYKQKYLAHFSDGQLEVLMKTGSTEKAL